ncbi:hypothetical protein V495_00408 [Pseudogymnoascus sp. VKM F-4514 (FW-929)]|nr:hypothetical protein V495_00408 [Pseudogymnoascus sp. VKM F-4514 (FW-929)]KFY66726.1 hypothetical protein V497_00746 [Pseudogymnoascus sp. VKM F-4516 (FW-969)]
MNSPPGPHGKGSVPLTVNTSRGTKRNEEKLTLQVRCDKAKPAPDSEKDKLYAAAMEDYEKRLKFILPSGYNGSSDDFSSPSLPTITDVDKVRVDSQGVGATAAEPPKQLKAHDYEGASRGAFRPDKLLGSFGTSKLLPPTQMTPKKRPSEDNLKGDRTKKNKKEKLMPPSLSSADNPGIPASSPSATPAKVYDTGVKDKSQIRNGAINDDASGIITVDSDQDMEDTRYTEGELREKLKEVIEKLALENEKAH